MFFKPKPVQTFTGEKKKNKKKQTTKKQNTNQQDSWAKWFTEKHIPGSSLPQL